MATKNRTEKTKAEKKKEREVKEEREIKEKKQYLWDTLERLEVILNDMDLSVQGLDSCENRFLDLRQFDVPEYLNFKQSQKDVQTAKEILINVIESNRSLARVFKDGLLEQGLEG